MEVFVSPGTCMQSVANSQDGSCDAIDIAELTAHLAAIGRVTGEFGEDEAMILAGRVVVILSYRQFLRVYPLIDFAGVVHQVLTLADYGASAQTHAHLVQEPRSRFEGEDTGDEIPVVVHRDGRTERFSPAILASSLSAASLAFSEFDEGQALVLAGDVAKTLGLRRVPSEPITSAELEEFVENVLIYRGHIVTARGIYCKANSEGGPQPIEEAVGSFLSLLEKAA